MGGGFAQGVIVESGARLPRNRQPCVCTRHWRLLGHDRVDVEPLRDEVLALQGQVNIYLQRGSENPEHISVMMSVLLLLPDLELYMRDQADRGAHTFGMTANGAEAHCRLSIDQRDVEIDQVEKSHHHLSSMARWCRFCIIRRVSCWCLSSTLHRRIFPSLL